MIHRLLLGLSLLAFVGAVASAATKDRTPTTPMPVGRTVYVSAGCYQCHGYAGQGGNAGPRLAGKAFPVEAFARQLRHPAEEMPPYSERVLDADQLAALHAYVLTLK